MIRVGVIKNKNSQAYFDCKHLIESFSDKYNSVPFSIQYFLVVFILLIGEFVVSVSITIWPNCLGLNLDDNTLVATLTDQYGIPGHEQFTAAIDLAQTQFKCCGISSNIDYDTSYWRSKSYGQKDLTVPLTCCVLDNEDDNVHTAYLDPKPSNLSVCQSIIRDEYLKARHPKSCREDIQAWYQRHFILFMGIISAVALVHFFVLLTIIYSCTELKRKRSESIDHHIAEFERKVNDRRNIITEVSSSSTRSSPMLSNAGRDSFMQQHQQRPTSMQDYNNIKQRNLSTFQTASNRSSNRGTKAYLV